MTALIVNVDDEIHKLGIVVKFIVFKNIRNQESNEVFESYRQQGLADIISGLSMFLKTMNFTTIPSLWISSSTLTISVFILFNMY